MKTVAFMFRMNGISPYESRDGLGRAKQDARAESTWMCGAIVSVLHAVEKIAARRRSHRFCSLFTFAVAVAEIEVPDQAE